MDEETTENSVEKEVATPEVQENVQDVAKVAEPQVPQEDVQEKNWKAMRQRQADLERQLKERDELLNKLASGFQQPVQQQKTEEEEDESEYANYAGVKKHAKKAVQPLEQKVQLLEAQLAYNNLLKKYPDFESVMTADAIAILEQEDPELCQTIAELKDPVKMGVQTYKYIKAMNIGDKIPNARRVREVEKKLDKSSKTVQSPIAYDKRPMAQAFKETEAEKKAIYEEMIGFASQAGFSY